MTEKFLVLIHSVSRGEAEPTRLRSSAELRQLELRILHAARRHEENRREKRPPGRWRLDAGTHWRLGGYPICFYKIRSKINSELGLQVIVSTEVVSALNSSTVLRSTHFGTNRIRFYENKFYSSRYYTMLPLLELVLQHLSMDVLGTAPDWTRLECLCLSFSLT